ncbi:MerR family transcriptional regulator [Azoarcus sp. CIB]|uniref:MerR family transcriptional regulator n=1 Tax=Aromatoleum sp. (strain CIB) TaxID=198107 RepID=UPI0006A2ABB8|nr:MerR family transcriptional regulator [Azoarcus sp. CIB]AKU11576.1 MerR family transcriptional regulator [Azoarcus sp. CIB]
MPAHAFTIRKLADAAGVGVEAVRYYQRRCLLHEPQRVAGGFREYAAEDVQRLRFIKRALELGFSLDDVAELVALSAERDQLHVRELTRRRAAEIRARIAQLEAMASALEGLASCCARAPRSQPCPIIAALAADPVTAIPAGEPQASQAPASGAAPPRQVRAVEC